MSNYKVCWITLCKNEEDIIPWCIQYWSRIADKVVVYDNHSTDSSVELLSQHDWIEIRTFESDGQDDVIQKTIKEKAYLEYRNKYDIIIISDMDEVFWFNDFKAVSEAFVKSDHNILMTPIYSLCEDSKPPYSKDLLLHEQCHKFYKQRMNHMRGLSDYSKLSIFNTKITEKVNMSVGQHFVQTEPEMKILLAKNAFCLHIDKGFGISYKFNIRQKMNANLSETNKRSGMCVEYGDSYDKLKAEYSNNQAKAIDINLTYTCAHAQKKKETE